jgi:hypothetical protein
MNPDPLAPDPFAVLGLPPWPDLDDETVKAAWVAIAAQTDPARPDGGDPARYAQATAAYHELCCPWGRSEAFADLLEQAWADGRYDAYPGHYPPGCDPDDDGDDDPEPPGNPWQRPPSLWLYDPKGMLLNLPWRIRHADLPSLAFGAAFITGLAFAALALFPHLPIPAVIAVCLFSFLGAGREDLAPPPGWPPPQNRQMPSARPRAPGWAGPRQADRP